MSKLRNTPSTPRRGRHTALAASALLVGSLAASMITACSSDAHNPTAPESAAKSPSMSYAPSNSWDTQQQLSGSQFTSSATSWYTTSGMMQTGTRLPETLLCGTSTSKAASMSTYIRPSTMAQTIQLGSVGTLTIPAGAVTAGFQLNASATFSANGINFDFQPHGTKFAKPLTLKTSYQGCNMRFTSPLNVFYVNDQGGILQTMPSSDNRSTSTIQALTDHFSHYMIAWS